MYKKKREDKRSFHEKVTIEKGCLEVGKSFLNAVIILERTAVMIGSQPKPSQRLNRVRIQ